MMTGSIRGLLVLAIVASGSACGGAGPRGEASPRDPDLITLAELERQGQYSNLYDVIEVLRSRWLRNQGPDRLQGPQGQVQVHMDGNWLGNVAVLRTISPAGVTSIRWLGPMDAAARYGFDHSHGAIVISTRVVH